MKQKVLYILLLLFACAWNTQAWGQTYNGGKWYSLYDESGFNIWTIDKKDYSVFAPTDKKLTFSYYYKGTLFPSHTTHVYESADGY